MTGTDPIDDLLRSASRRRPPSSDAPDAARVALDLDRRRRRRRRTRLATGLAALAVVAGGAAVATGIAASAPPTPTDEIAGPAPTTTATTATPTIPTTEPCPPDPVEPCTSPSGVEATPVRVVGPDGAPVTGARVQVRGAGGEVLDLLPTAPDGTTTLPGGVEAPLRLTATAPDPPPEGCASPARGEADLAGPPSASEVVTIELSACR